MTFDPTEPSPTVDRPSGYDQLNRYTTIIVDEAQQRGIHVEVGDPSLGELTLSLDGRRVRTFESLSELTSAVAFVRCSDKVLTRQVLLRAGLPVPEGVEATFDGGDEAFLARCGDLVVKPAVGEGGAGITVGVTDPHGLRTAVERARAVAPRVLLERCHEGHDLRIVVIGGAVVAASVRRPPTVEGDGRRTIAELLSALADERSAATDGASHLSLDETTLGVLAGDGVTPLDVLPEGALQRVRRTANVHTGGTIEDVTDHIDPGLGAVAVAVAEAIVIPVVGVDLIAPDLKAPDCVVIEANEQPGLANHEPRPTAARFVDLLFPATVRSR